MATDRVALPPLEDELKLIVDTAAEAGALALPYFHGDVDLDVELKSGNSPVSAADYAVNHFLHENLMSARPDYGWLSEETEDDDTDKRVAAPRTFIVDPIDGTRGFIEGRNMWCVSVAIVENGEAIAGALICPARDEIYSATKNGGAHLNNARLTLSEGYERPIIIGGPRVFVDRFDAEIDDEIYRHPHVPSLAYRIARVASGKLHATFIKPNSHEWDIAAAGLILAEAGGLLCDEAGASVRLNEHNVKQPVLVAMRPDLKDQMLGIVQRYPLG